MLVVDDSQYTAEMLQDILREEFEIVGETGSGDEAVELYEELDPDVVVMDLIIRGTDGISATATIKERDPDANVLVLSSVDNATKKREAADAGADGYISKPFEPAELLDSMRTLASDH